MVSPVKMHKAVKYAIKRSSLPEDVFMKIARPETGTRYFFAMMTSRVFCGNDPSLFLDSFDQIKVGRI